jgi:hypothetical protein
MRVQLELDFDESTYLSPLYSVKELEDLEEFLIWSRSSPAYCLIKTVCDERDSTLVG